MSGQRKDWISFLVGIPLFILSLIYGMIVRVIFVCYSSGILPRRKLNVPVISIGNLTMGGVGKTPMAIFVARMLKVKKFKPVILTRGYMPRSMAQDSGQVEYVSDEAQVLREMLEDIPVVVHPDRHKGGMEAIDRYDPDVIILDDGFQHWRLFRDLEIVLIDAVNPFGNGHLLPLGILREPFSSLKRADLLILTKTDRVDTGELKKRLQLRCPGIPVIETAHRPRSLTNVYTKEIRSLTEIVRPVVAFCGIGDPLSFKSMLVSLCADVKEFVHFMDHHTYCAQDMDDLRNICDVLGIRTVITTRKDAVKLNVFKEKWQGYDILALNIEIDITQGQREFIDRIDRLQHS